MGSEEEPEHEERGDGASGASEGAADATPDAGDAPAWADGLKQLYRSVVDEPLPGSFKYLLDQFDETGEDGSPSDPGDPA